MHARASLLEVDELGEIDASEWANRIELLAQHRNHASSGESGVNPARECDDEDRITEIGPPIDVQHSPTLLPPSLAARAGVTSR